MAVAGAITVDGTVFEIAGAGLRDHSWGPRSWQAPWFYRWLHGSSPQFGFMGAFFDKVLVAIRAVGVYFPDLLMTHGNTRCASPPFVPGVEVSVSLSPHLPEVPYPRAMRWWPSARNWAGTRNSLPPLPRWLL
ncbi:hypothetical protein ACQP2U_22680 [Nocardia sp. CA-084685]|uniref:hypothetical protein n=1 Tax=Nocardia sp. CA-084685 TaxID=3239970 RepID=UPI003D9906A8